MRKSAILSKVESSGLWSIVGQGPPTPPFPVPVYDGSSKNVTDAKEQPDFRLASPARPQRATYALPLRRGGSARSCDEDARYVGLCAAEAEQEAPVGGRERRCMKRLGLGFKVEG